MTLSRLMPLALVLSALGCGQPPSSVPEQVGADADTDGESGALHPDTGPEVSDSDAPSNDTGNATTTDGGSADSTTPDATETVQDTTHDAGLTSDSAVPDALQEDSATSDGEVTIDAVPACVPADCDDANPCTLDKCIGGTCVHGALPDGAQCSDGDACTGADTCSNGTCVGGSIKVCGDGQCELANCDPTTGKCKPAQDGLACDDKDKCTLLDVCVAGVCTGETVGQGACDDGDVCTTDSCLPISGCVHNANSAACSDGNACTVGDACKGGGCVAGPIGQCLDANECTSDACDPAVGCTHVSLPDGTTCTSGDKCTIGTACTLGACTSKGPKLFDLELTSAQTLNDVVVLEDGFAAIGATVKSGAGGQDFWLVRTDAAGKTIWEKTYGGTGNEIGKALVSVTDGYLLVGSTTSAGPGNSDWIVRTDTSGAQLWWQTMDIGVVGIASVPKGFAVLGNKNATVSRIDDSGTVQWSQSYGSTGVVSPAAIVALADGFVIGGWKQALNGTHEAWLLRLDSGGSPLWEQTYGPKMQWGSGLVALPDGFALGGYNTGGGGWVVRTDLAGNKQWAKTYDSLVQGIAVASDGLCVTGRTGSPVTDATLQAWFGRLDSSGVLQSEQSFGAPGTDYPTRIVSMADGFVLSGTKLAAGSWAGGWLARLDPWGYANCSAAGGCVATTPTMCDDKNPCTLDQCLGASGCSHEALPAGTGCAPGKTCKFGVCAP